MRNLVYFVVVCIRHLQKLAWSLATSLEILHWNVKHLVKGRCQECNQSQYSRTRQQEAPIGCFWSLLCLLWISGELRNFKEWKKSWLSVRYYSAFHWEICWMQQEMNVFGCINQRTQEVWGEDRYSGALSCVLKIFTLILFLCCGNESLTSGV